MRKNIQPLNNEGQEFIGQGGEEAGAGVKGKAEVEAGAKGKVGVEVEAKVEAAAHSICDLGLVSKRSRDRGTRRPKLKRASVSIYNVIRN